MGVMDRDWYQERFLRNVLGIRRDTKSATFVSKSERRERQVGWLRLGAIASGIVLLVVASMAALRAYL